MSTDSLINTQGTSNDNSLKKYELADIFKECHQQFKKQPKTPIKNQPHHT